MCEFCHKHGEGKKWYLQAKNYSDDLLSDLRRQRFIKNFFSHPEHLFEEVEGLSRLDRAPTIIRATLIPIISNRQKKMHFGQVVPIEDIERILDFTTSVVRVACICRHGSTGTEQRYCYGLTTSPQESKFGQILREIDTSYLIGPHTGGLEKLSKDEALTSLRNHEKEGLCHTVWTFITPFIASICNCDRSDCMAMRATLIHRMPVFFRGEYVARVDPDLCNGCRQCMRLCQFGALAYSAASKKVVVDSTRCYGCGTCRAGCTKDALILNDRASVPAASRLW